MNHLRQLLFFIVFCVAAAINVVAQENFIRFERISSKEGLTNSVVHTILQDKKGFMWFGTQGGLSRYDGYKFVDFKHNPRDPLSLPVTKVLSMHESKDGELWIGTDGGGLSRFNREQENFIHYQYKNTQDPAPTGEVNIIKIIYGDDDGVLWIGSGGGLLRFNPKTNEWSRYSHSIDDPWNINNNVVNAIYKDKDGMIWIGTDGGGLNVFDPKSNTFKQYMHDPDDPDSLCSNLIKEIIEYSEGKLWIGTSNGLDVFDRKTQKFIHYKHDPQKPNSLSHNHLRAMFVDSKKQLWLCTEGGGLDRLKSREEMTFIRYRHEANNPYSLSHNTIYSIAEDRAGSIWIGTFGGGVNRIDPLMQQFGHIYSNSNDSSGLSSNDISAFCQDDKGALWVGTNSNGLNKYDPKSGNFVRYDMEKGLSSNEVVALHKDSISKNLWIGTWGAGLNCMNSQTENFKQYKEISELDYKGPSSNYIFCFNEDDDHNLWIGTWGGGLDRFNRKSEDFTHYRHDPNKPTSVSDKGVTVVYPDLSDKEYLWVGTYTNGLDRFHIPRGVFHHNIHNPKDPNSISNNAIRALYVSPREPGVVWVGTLGGGINRFDIKKQEWHSYTELDNLSSNTIYGILEDKHGMLWLSTNNGLSRFNPINGHFTNYDESDGLQSNEFTQGAFYKNDNGRFFFGGINGYNSFIPEDISKNTYVPPILITAFKVRNEEKKLNKSILETKELHLSYKDYIISFEFAALNYTARAKNQYQYKMEGLDENWIQLGSKRDATFTRLDPGRYTFRVKGSNNDGIWNEEGTSIVVVIHPPFWGTWWFKLMGMLLLGGTVVVAYKLRVRSYKMQRKMLAEEVAVRTHEIRHQKEIIEEKNEQLEVSNRDLRKSEENLLELNATKDKFFSIISHDMRNHLTTLMGTADLLANNFDILPDEKKQKQSMAINKSAVQLHELLENLLQWARSQTGGLRCKFQKLDLVSTVDHIISSLSLNAKKKKIELFKETPEKIEAYADKNMISTVLRNIVSNAIKFTEKGGWVKVVAEEIDNDVMVSVIDNGVGISREKQSALFKIGMNQSTKGTANEKGTGLGLILCKEFIEKNNGDIWYEQADEAGISDSGSIFRFTLPKNDDTLGSSE